MHWLEAAREADQRKLIGGGFRKTALNIWRRFLGRYSLDDPRPIARDAPYTFFLPSQRELDSLEAGDLVKLAFRSHPVGTEWDVERMWVEISDASPTGLKGLLCNIPSDMPQLKPGDAISFQRFHVLATQKDLPDEPPRREYWERCLVDKCVTDDRVPVHYLYREEPDMARDGDTYPDSGWRIRGDYRGLTDQEIDARSKEYVALGRALNADDSWLHLIDAPVGSSFIRDFATGAFLPD